MYVCFPDHKYLLLLSKPPYITNYSEVLKIESIQDWKYFNFQKLRETSRCHKIAFVWTNIQVFVLVGIVSLCRFWKYPILGWKVPKILHYSYFPRYTGQFWQIHCIRDSKLIVTIWKVLIRAELFILLLAIHINPTMMFFWWIFLFKCKL